ncbi:hypothetical protein [Streptomyces sp. NPDC017448]|uniref:hypothetical protein n=1 Tax=Streptomyces sp. NPDC017448 TaxID=3364996 RepID=UPI003790C1C8
MTASTPDHARVLGQIARGEVRAGADAAREIAARHEAAYGGAFISPDVPDGEVQFTGFDHPVPLSGWHYTELAPDYYGHVFMQLGGWLPEGWPREDTPAGTARMKYAHLHGRAVPRDLNVQVSTTGYGGPRRFITIQWRKDGAA